MISSVSVFFFFYCSVSLSLSVSLLDTLFGRPVPYKPVLMLLGNLRYDVNLCINVFVEKGWNLFMFSFELVLWFDNCSAIQKQAGSFRHLASTIYGGRDFSPDV